MKGFLCLLINLVFLKQTFSFFKDEQYDAPPLYNFHNYDWCFRQNSNESIFCIVEAQVQPNISSTAWQVISSFIKPKQQFRHDHLQYGLCKSECLKVSPNFDDVLYQKKLITSNLV